MAHIHETKADRAFMAFIYLVLAIITISVLYPLIYVLSSSFSSPAAVLAGKVRLLPVDFSLEGYQVVLGSSKIVRGYLNTILYTTVGTSINVAMTVMTGYALSKRDLFGKRFFVFLFTFTMMFSGGLMPTYLLVKNLHLLDTMWALVLPGAMAVYQMIVARTFFMTNIPYDLYESSQLDGCSDLRYLWSVVLPLSKALLAVLVLLYAVGHWNTYFNAMIYLSSPEKYPLQIILREILLQNTIDYTDINSIENSVKQDDLQELIKYTLIVVSSAPILILYPFIQKYFVKGVMVGSIKG